MKKYDWDISANNSTIILKTKYLVYGHIMANFSDFKGNICTEESFRNPEIFLNINAASINTLVPGQDDKFRSEAYFSTLEFPFITFNSINGCGLSPGGIQELNGTLLIKGINQRITFIVNFSEFKSFGGNSSARFRLFCRINLKDWQVGINDEYGISDDALILVEMNLITRKKNLINQN